MPECVSSTRVVGVAPIAVDDLMLLYCAEAESIALWALLREAEQSAAFTLVAADVLLAEMERQAGGFEWETTSRLRLAHGDGGDSLDTEALLAAAEQLALDGVLFCRVRGHEYTSTSTESEFDIFALVGLNDGELFKEGKVTETTKWSGAEVILQVVQVSSGDLIAESRFDSNGHQESLGWWNTPPASEGIVDVIEHTFGPIAEAWTR